MESRYAYIELRCSDWPFGPELCIVRAVEGGVPGRELLRYRLPPGTGPSYAFISHLYDEIERLGYRFTDYAFRAEA